METAPTAAPVSDDPGSAMQHLLARQRAAFLREGPPTLALRLSALSRLRAAVLDRREAIAAAISADFGHRSPDETAIMELMPLLQTLRHQQRHLKRWMRPERRAVPSTLQPARAFVLHQPLGVVGIMVPWNYPVSLALTPLATALAAGNRVMIKPSEAAPASAALLAALVAEVFPIEQVAVVQGDVAEGRAFAALPFDHLLFTGSTAVGRAVMRAASEHLVPVTLELGGKSPAIVTAGYPADVAAQAIAYGKFANAGQTCIAPDHVLVPEGTETAFVEALDRAVRRLYPDGPDTRQYTSIVNERHHQRLLDVIEDARAAGATIRPLGVAGTAGGRPHTLAPTAVLGATDSMRVMREEIFGPVLPVVGHRGPEDFIARINAQPRPLALYLFGEDPAVREAVLSRTTSGNVTINNTLLHYAHEGLPFGGVGPSGMGAYHGIEGFKTFSHAKGVFVQRRWHPSHLLRPPYGRVARTLLHFLLR